MPAVPIPSPATSHYLPRTELALAKLYRARRPSPTWTALPHPPAGAHGPFVHARATAPKTILYTDADGRDEIREGGSRSWRNCNPGNIRKGDFSINCGAIGDDGSFAIFPDEDTGKAAVIALLQTTSYIQDTQGRYLPLCAPERE